jgi:hypothetical protein
MHISAKGAENTNNFMVAMGGGLVESSDSTKPSRTDINIGASVQKEAHTLQVAILAGQNERI